MKVCPNCHRELQDGDNFCPSCGYMFNGQPAQPVEPFGVDAEKGFLDSISKVLRWERKAWKIAGIVILVMSIVFLALGFLFFIGFAAADSSGEGVIVGGALFFVYFLYGALLLPIGIIDLQAEKKIPFYLDSIYNDVTYTRSRCGSVGMLVFTAIFNTIAFIFFLINFIKIKSNRAMLDSIERRQRGQ